MSSQDSLSHIDPPSTLPHVDDQKNFNESNFIETPAFNEAFQNLGNKDFLFRKKGRPSIYEGAEYPELLDKAKLILPSTNYDIEKLLELEEFKKLRFSKDLPRFLSKYVLNKLQKKGSKSMIEKSFVSPENPIKSIIDYKNLGDQPTRFSPNQQTILPSQSQQTPQANYGAKIQSEITSNYLREYMLLKPSERYQFLEKICLRNSQSLLEFLINLKTTCSSNFYDGMFSLVHELNLNLKIELQIKTRLFVQSLLYYRDEKIQIDPALLKSSMILLAHRPNSEQTLGLANYIFINEIEAFSMLQEELFLLDSKNIGIIPLMAGTFTSFKIDAQVIRLLPNTLLCLTKPFIQILKQEYGLRLIRQIPVEVVGDFVQICALCQQRTYEDLDFMINHIKDIFIQKWDFLDQSDFSLLIAQISVELKERNINWVGKLKEIIEIVNKVVAIQLEKGIKNRPDLILDLVNGNQFSIKQILKNPKQVDEFSQQQFYKMINKFKKLNKDNKLVERYCIEVSEKLAFSNYCLNDLEDLLGFKFLTLQKLCLNFYSQQTEKYIFMNIGIGNGKTLLCASIAILVSKEKNKSSIILGKNDYLVLRDEKRFQKLILGSGLNINSNQYEQKQGVYYMTQKYFESQWHNKKFKQFVSESILVIDEYDWLIFDGTPQIMLQNIQYLKSAGTVVGLTGSELSQKEEICLKIAFQTEEIRFPNLSSLKQDKKVHLQDLLFSQSQQEYCKYLYELAMKQTLLTPVLIVASQSYSMIENYFKKFNELQFYSMKIAKGSKADAYLEEKFNVRNMNKRFSVFLLSEIQGRGTDLQTSREIEQNGGLYLIIGDIFSKRSTSQIIGRVGRLENKGQHRTIIWQGGSQDTIEQAISFKQEFIENENHIRFSKLQTNLYQLFGQEEEKQISLSDDSSEKILYSFKSALVTNQSQKQNLEILNSSIQSQIVKEPQTIEQNKIKQEKLQNINNKDAINENISISQKALTVNYTNSLNDFSDLDNDIKKNYTYNNEPSDDEYEKEIGFTQVLNKRKMKLLNKDHKNQQSQQNKNPISINQDEGKKEIIVQSRSKKVQNEIKLSKKIPEILNKRITRSSQKADQQSKPQNPFIKLQTPFNSVFVALICQVTINFASFLLNEIKNS